MKAKILKLAGVKTEKEFYKLFPNEASFMKKHGKALGKSNNTSEIDDNIPRMSAGGILQSTTGGIGTGAGIGAMFGGAGAIPGAIIGGALGLVGGLFGNGAENKAKKMEAAKLRNTELDMELAQEELDRSDEQFRYGQFAEDGNYQQGFYAKGGAIDRIGDNNMNIDNNTTPRRVGNGIELDTTKSGTDTIKATIGGKKVRLDDNEIVVTDSNGQPVIISDDNGETTKYKKAIKGKSKREVSAITQVFAERAKAKGVNTGNNFQFGGNFASNLTKPLNIDPYYDLNRTSKYPLGLSQYDTTIKPIDKITGFPNQYADKLSISNLPNSKPISMDINNTQPKVTPTKGINTINAIGQVGNFALGLANTFENAAARKKLAETSLPTPVIPKYSDLNVNVNDPSYNLQRSRIGAGSKALGDAIQRNTSSSNTAVAALSNIEANKLSAEGDTFVNQRVAQDKIRNINISRRNAHDAQVAGIGNEFNQMAYQDRIGRINTDLALAKSSIAGGQAIIDNLQKGQYDREQIKALGASLGLKLTGNETMAELTRLIKQGTNKQLETVVGKTT